MKTLFILSMYFSSSGRSIVSTILLVDDGETYKQMWSQMLRRYGDIKLNKYYRVTRKLTTRDSVFPLSLFNMSDRTDIVCSLLPLSISFIIIFFCLFLNKRRFNIRKKKRCWFFHIMLTFAIKSRISDSVFSWFSNNEILEKKWIRIAFLKKLTEGFI